MKTRHVWLFFLLLVAPGYLFAQSNPVFENVTLQQDNGWTYSEVSVRLADEESWVIVTRPDGATLTIHVGNVAKIVDAQGTDITLQVIPVSRQMEGKRYNEFTVIDDSGRATSPNPGTVPLPPALFDVMFGGGVGYGKPVGSFYDGMDSGLLYYADVRFTISPLVYIKAAYRSENVYEDTIEVYDYYSETLYTGDVSLDVRQYIVTFGFLDRPKARNNLRAYGEVGAAYVDHLAKATVNGITSTVSESRVMMVGGGGLLVPLSESLGLDAGATFMFKPFDGDDGEGFGMIASGHVGLTASFGGGK